MGLLCSFLCNVGWALLTITISSISNLGNLETWLASAGLSFNPFKVLEASADSHLLSYLVGHDAFEAAWGEWTSFIFAPAGGGKTALRSRITQACWATQQTNRPFPLVYSPPFLKWGHVTPTLDDHIAALTEAGALYLLLILFHRPHWFMELSKEEKYIIRNIFDSCLPGPLESYLGACDAVNNVSPFSEKFQPASLPPDSPSGIILKEFISALRKTPTKFTSARSETIVLWKTFTDVIINVLQIPAIYILLDGLDSTSSTAENPDVAVNVIEPILRESLQWASQKVYFKAFIPIETRPQLEKRHSNLVNQSQTVDLIWTPDLLAEVIRRRVYVASRGEFGSLSAIASPPLFDFELTLAKQVFPLPREILALTHRVINDSASRGNLISMITEEDFYTALQWYKSNNIYSEKKN